MACREIALFAIFGNPDAFHQFHHEVRPACFRRARVEDFGDVRMVHQREGLALGLEAGDHGLGVHAQLDDLERDAATDRFLLFGQVHNAAATLTDLLKQFVMADAIPGISGDWRTQLGGRLSRLVRQKPAFFLTRPEEGLHAGEQRRILTASLLQETLPFLTGLQVERLLEDFLLAVWRRLVGHRFSIQSVRRNRRCWAKKFSDKGASLPCAPRIGLRKTAGTEYRCPTLTNSFSILRKARRARKPTSVWPCVRQGPRLSRRPH